MAIFPRKRRQGLIGVPDYSAAESLSPPDGTARTGSKSYTISKTGWYVWVPNDFVALKSWSGWWYVNNLLIACVSIGNDGGHTDSKIFPVSLGDVVKVRWPGRNTGIASGNCKMYLIPVKYITT